MLLTLLVVGCLNWPLALASGGVVITDSVPGVVRIHLGDPPPMTLTGQFQSTVTSVDL